MTSEPFATIIPNLFVSYALLVFLTLYSRMWTIWRPTPYLTSTFLTSLALVSKESITIRKKCFFSYWGQLWLDFTFREGLLFEKIYFYLNIWTHTICRPGSINLTLYFKIPEAWEDKMAGPYKERCIYSQTVIWRWQSLSRHCNKCPVGNWH